MRHHAIISFFLLFVASQLSGEAFAVDSESNREAVVSPRAKRFYRSSSARQYLSLGGNYTSDYNSKSNQLTSRYLYQSNKFIHEINFQIENTYADSGSGTSKRYDVKKSELYDLTASSKTRLGDSKNYGVFFHRTMYDDLSKYYYDLHTAVGLGRMLLRDKVELDISIGYHDIKFYGYKVDVIPSIRTNFKLSQNLTLTQRGYWFLDHESMDNELKTSLVYRLSQKMSFELRHSFEKRRYEDDSSRVVTNQVSRSVTIGLIFDLE
jgi:hypothetical protein